MTTTSTLLAFKSLEDWYDSDHENHAEIEHEEAAGENIERYDLTIGDAQDKGRCHGFGLVEIFDISTAAVSGDDSGSESEC